MLLWKIKGKQGVENVPSCPIYDMDLLSFVMIYLTNTIGLNAGIVETLIAASKLLEFGEYLKAA